MRQQPLGTVTEAELPVASWDQVRIGLREILDISCNPAPGMISLSNVKHLFRTQINLELSETALGYSRLGELLQDARLDSVCTLQPIGIGQTLVQRVQRHCLLGQTPFYCIQPMQQAPLSICPSSDAMRFSTCASTRLPTLATVQPPLPEPSLSELLLIPAGGVPGFCQNCAPVSPGGGWCSVSDASTTSNETCNSELFSDITGDELETRSCASTWTCSPCSAESELHCPKSALAGGATEEMRLETPTAFAKCGFVVKNSFFHQPPLVDSGARRRSRSEPRECC